MGRQGDRKNEFGDDELTDRRRATGTQPGVPAKVTGSQPSVRSDRVTSSQPAVRAEPRVTASYPTSPSQGPRASGNPGFQALTGVRNALAGRRTGKPRPNPPKPLFTAHQRQMLSSGFTDSEAERKRMAMLGASSPSTSADEERDAEVTTTHLLQVYDGVTPAPQLTGRDVWKAVQAPIQSREGRRNVKVYQQVINQFAVGKNPRYEPEAPDRLRSHIFVWDVSRAMNCEIPHFLGAKEQSLGHTVDWLRHEGPMRGWVKAVEAEAFAHAGAGRMVVALPRDIKLKLMAVVAPQARPADGRPLLTGAGRMRGASISVAELFGVRQAEYYFHP